MTVTLERCRGEGKGRGEVIEVMDVIEVMEVRR
jgi:hypothetical protein